MNKIFFEKMAVIFSLSNAINSLNDLFMNFEHSWEDKIYNYNSETGIKSSISFENQNFLICIQDYSKLNIREI